VLLFANLGAIFIFSSRASVALPADINDDGVVNITDLSILLSNWGKTVTPNPPGPTPNPPGPTPNPPGPNPNPNPGEQTLGVGGVATPAGAILATGDSTSTLTITSGGTADNPKVYDGKGFKVGKISIKADNVVVQNYRVCPNGVYGIEIPPRRTNVTVQNNDIKCVKGPGDLNAITFFGNNLKFLYNTMEDWVVGDPGKSHTDCFQTWNNDPNESSSYIVIKGNRCTGPLQGQGNYTVHQCVMAQGKAATDGGGGGSGNSEHWIIDGNYWKDDWNQCIKLEDIDDAHVTRNTFAGASSRIIEIRSTSVGTFYYSDNIVTGSYGSVGVTAKPGPGPTTLPGL
jgi:hypothetical protein